MQTRERPGGGRSALASDSPDVVTSAVPVPARNVRSTPLSSRLGSAMASDFSVEWQQSAGLERDGEGHDPRR